MFIENGIRITQEIILEPTIYDSIEEPILEPIDYSQYTDIASEIQKQLASEGFTLDIGEPDVPEEHRTLMYYVQFTERELAYIQGSGEITSAYAKEVVGWKRKELLMYKDVRQAESFMKYDQYADKRTAMTSQEVLDVPITYKDWIAEDFADLWKSDEYNYGHDKCIYMMRKLGIFNKSEWSSLTGYVSKGDRFLPEVGKNIGKTIGVVGTVIGDVIGDVYSGVFEGLLGPEWKSKLIIGLVITGVVGVGGLISYHYGKTYIGSKARKRAEK